MMIEQQSCVIYQILFLVLSLKSGIGHLSDKLISPVIPLKSNEDTNFEFAEMLLLIEISPLLKICNIKIFCQWKWKLLEFVVSKNISQVTVPELRKLFKKFYELPFLSSNLKV